MMQISMEQVKDRLKEKGGWEAMPAHIKPRIKPWKGGWRIVGVAAEVTFNSLPDAMIHLRILGKRMMYDDDGLSYAILIGYRKSSWIRVICRELENEQDT